MKKTLRLIAIFMAIALLITAAGCSSSSSTNQQTQSNSNQPTKPQQQITLNMVTFLPKDNALLAVVPKWIERVETATGGQVKINWKGGPEVIPAMQQIDAVRNGVIDINFNVTAYYQNLAPELQAFSLSEFTPSEERQNGFYDYMADHHKKIGVVYLGRWLGNEPFYFWLNKPAATLADLKGRSLRTQALYDRFMKALGITPVSVDTSEVYTSLASNIVQGFGFTLLGPRQSGWTEKTKYIIDQPFYNQNGTIIVNPNSWAKISPELQKKVVDATAQFENDMLAFFNDANQKERAALQKDGVQFIKFSPEEMNTYLKTAYDVEWKNIEKMVPDQVSQLEKICRKK